jgi:hypothetical protein
MNTDLECGFATEEFRDKIKNKLNEWFGGEDKYTILFIWYEGKSAYVSAMFTVRDHEIILYFLRLWDMFGKIEISQDRKLEL